jgi:Protein of unknown function (DUF1153)
MIEYRNVRPASVIGPLGEVLTLAALPPGNTTRWVARRKAEVVAAVDGGLLSVDEVLKRYELSLEEFQSWRHAMDRAGVPGLRVAHIQRDRDDRRRAPALHFIDPALPPLRRNAEAPVRHPELLAV